MKKIFAILIALSALSNFSCKEKEEEYTEGGLVFGGIYMLDGQQLVETDVRTRRIQGRRIHHKGHPRSGIGEVGNLRLHRRRIQRRTAPYSTLSPNAPSRRRHEHRTAKGNPDTVHHEHFKLLDGVESTHRPAGGQIKEKGVLRLLFSCCKQIVPDLFVESFLRLLTSAEPAQAQLYTRLNETGPYRSTMSL